MKEFTFAADVIGFFKISAKNMPVERIVLINGKAFAFNDFKVAGTMKNHSDDTLLWVNNVKPVFDFKKLRLLVKVAGKTGAVKIINRRNIFSDFWVSKNRCMKGKISAL